MHVMNDTWPHSDILGIGTSPGGSNALPIAGVIQDSEPKLQNFATVFDPSSGCQNISQSATACSFNLPLMVQPPPVTTIPENFQMPITQGSVRCCPQCQAMLKDLREHIIAITCGQGLPSGGGGIGALWRSYFGLVDHLHDGHVARVGGLAG